MASVRKFSLFLFLLTTSLLLTLFTAKDSHADDVSIEGEGIEIIHTVVKGDTLWDITGTYLDDPFLWPKVWRLTGNDYIRNPHLIYPGEKIRISDDVFIVCGPEIPDSECVPPKKDIVVEIPPKPTVGVCTENCDDLPPPDPTTPGPEPETPVVEPTPEAPKVVVLEPKATIDLPIKVLEPKKADEEPVWIETIEDTLRRKISTVFMSKTGFLSTEERERTGGIIAPKDKGRTILADRDVVYVTFENAGKIVEGDSFTIFRENGIAYHPESGSPIGYYIDIIGQLKILYATDDVIEAEIERSFQEIEIGMELIKATQMPESMAVTETDRSIEGAIMANRDKKVIMSEFDIIYIDRGKNSGLVAGNLMRVFRPRPDAPNPVKGGKTPLPDIALGEVLVIDVKDEYSTALVLRTSDHLKAGDLVSTDF